jgi:hypothetical protein
VISFHGDDEDALLDCVIMDEAKEFAIKASLHSAQPELQAYKYASSSCSFHICRRCVAHTALRFKAAVSAIAPLFGQT